MAWYNVLLFAHILGAVVLVGGSLMGPLVMRRLRTATSVASLRTVAGIVHAVSKASGPSAGLVLIAGVGMVLSNWSFGDGWIAVSLSLFVLSGVLAMAVADPVLKRLVTLAEETPEGPVTPELRELVHDPKMSAAHNVLLTVDVVIVALMTLKPGLAVSAAMALAAIAAGVALTVAERGRATPAAAS